MTTTSPRIVVGYDGSPDADLALAWAVGSSRARGLCVDVVIVATHMDPVVGHFRELADQAVDEWRLRANDMLMELDAVNGQVDVERGPTVPVLLEAAQSAGLLVVGSRGHGLVRGSLSGSVSQHVARHARCPVVVVRAARSPRARRIVVGVDGSVESMAALRFAFERAQDSGEQVAAVHGYFGFLTMTGSLDDVFSTRTIKHIERAERMLAEAVAGFGGEFPDVDVSTAVSAVAADRLLVDQSAEASHLVVGSRGRDAFAEMLLGSVSQQVLHHAHCPVAVVR